MYCERCNRLVYKDRCPGCGRKDLRIPQQDDFCFLTEPEHLWSQALRALVDFFFDEVGCNRICADHDIENPASGRVMEKAGMRFEGTARQGGHTNRGIVDICHWAILRSDR